MAAAENFVETRLAVIGGGPGGYAAAFAAADLGLEVTLVNADPRPGGVCLHRGCIPSKALLHVAKLLSETREAARWGVTFAEPTVDLDALRDWKNRVIGTLAHGVETLCKRRGVQLLRGRAAFTDSSTIRVDPIDTTAKDRDVTATRVRYEHAILATGSNSVIPDMCQISDPRVMDSTAALALPDVPARLLVIGGGYIGLELGTVYAALGSRVTVVELTGGLLPGADRDLVRPLRNRLKETFEAVWLDTTVEGLGARPEGIVVRFNGAGVPAEQTFDRVLVAVGRTPNSIGLGLENTRVRTDDRGFVQVDRQQRTDDPLILAVGDVAGPPMLAHKASCEAKVAAEVVAGRAAAFDNMAIPGVVFTDPELAWCGLTETEAKAQGREIKAVRFPWAASGRAVTRGRTEGHTKLIFDPQTQRLLGVGIVGSGAGELIAEGTLAVEMGAAARDLSGTIHAHPTLSETIGEAAEAFFGNATHLFRPKR